MVSDDTASAFADPRRVRQIVRNLVTNANRYGGPHIAVSFEASSSTASLIIADDGEPIPKDRRDAIFDPYTTAQIAVADVGSIGLGLFISRALAQLMGGDLDYNHDGSHSRFRLTLPAGVSDGPIPVPPPVPVRSS